jgi:hypothetical protein
MMMVAVPLLRVAALDVYPPPDTATEPVGVALPLPPATTTVRVSDWLFVIAEAEGVTVTAGVVLAAVVTATNADPFEPM